MSYCLSTYIMSSQWVVSLLIPFYFNSFNTFWELHMSIAFTSFFPHVLHHQFFLPFHLSSRYSDWLCATPWIFVSLMCILPKTIFIDFCSLVWGGNKLWIFTIHHSATYKQVILIPASKDEILENIFSKQSIIRSWIYAGEFLKCLTCANRFRHIGYTKIFGWF